LSVALTLTALVARTGIAASRAPDLAWRAAACCVSARSF
jgi:hypothetical protein